MELRIAVGNDGFINIHRNMGNVPKILMSFLELFFLNLVKRRLCYDSYNLIFYDMK